MRTITVSLDKDCDVILKKLKKERYTASEAVRVALKKTFGKYLNSKQKKRRTK